MSGIIVMELWVMKLRFSAGSGISVNLEPPDGDVHVASCFPQVKASST